MILKCKNNSYTGKVSLFNEETIIFNMTVGSEYQVQILKTIKLTAATKILNSVAAIQQGYNLIIFDDNQIFNEYEISDFDLNHVLKSIFILDSI